MIQTAIARRYAKALFELQEPADVGPTAKTLRVLAEAFAGSREFRNLLLSPVFTREQKAAVVAQLAAKTACPPITGRFLAHVVRKNRIAQLREISDAFGRLADQVSNRKVVEVAAARPLTDEQQAAIRTKLEQVTRSQIDLSIHVDPAVLGGLEIRIGSTVYDGTVRGQLARLRSALAKV
ncbi:MAG: ATP synthase F1 subunit delta [Nitrospirae bacterium]|nr:MAG: ATP synthase F1 subunit delta [Nitrospirota bacterium]